MTSTAPADDIEQVINIAVVAVAMAPSAKLDSMGLVEFQTVGMSPCAEPQPRSRRSGTLTHLHQPQQSYRRSAAARPNETFDAADVPDAIGAGEVSAAVAVTDIGAGASGVEVVVVVVGGADAGGESTAGN